MSVNMLRLRVRTEAQPRTKNGQPHQSTTGVASTSCSHTDTCGGTRSLTQLSRSPPISSRTTGIVNATPIQNRRVMSSSSALGPVSAVTMTGSRAIPQIGHAPGPGWRICGCIGQVYSATSPVGCPAGWALGPGSRSPPSPWWACSACS